MRILLSSLLGALIMNLVVSSTRAQPYGQPDEGEPGDSMIQGYLQRESQKIHDQFLEGTESLDAWQKHRVQWKEEYLTMLGLWPFPQATPIHATITGSLEGDGYVVDMLHYQSRPGLYVTGNLYRPTAMEPGTRLPAVFYVCGHSNQGRDGNKTAYQSHGIWFARHGYLCLTVDTLQRGEIAAIHHGTYRENRWWWHARGYTPAGVECWNGMRGIDYLISRPDVDPNRIAVTGISGGGATTFWIAAADDRVRVAVPVSGMADLPSYVGNRVINGHCDCMFLYNIFQWPWTRIAALVAPRPLLFVNSDQDSIFPMDANERVINRLERVYSLHGAGDLVDAVVSMGGHAYRQDIRQAAFRFLNTHLKNHPQIVTDSEVDLVTESGNRKNYPIDPVRLRVFPQDSDIPPDEINTTIDEIFVPKGHVEPPDPGQFVAWKTSLEKELRRITFRYFPERIPAAEVAQQPEPNSIWMTTEPGIRVQMHPFAESVPNESSQRILLEVCYPDGSLNGSDWIARFRNPGDILYQIMPRGVGPTRWTRKNPPNYVERSLALLGRTADTGRVWDIIAAARYLHMKYEGKVPVHVMGAGGAGILAAYAALWEPEIDGVIIKDPPLSHGDNQAPQFLNVLRVCDVPDVLGMLAPRMLTVSCQDRSAFDKVVKIYTSAGVPDQVVVRDRREVVNEGQAAKRPPNILYIMADDLGYGDLGCYGQKVIQTPNLDRMASEGLRFTDHYAGHTVCRPSRLVLLTGRHSGHTPIDSNATYILEPGAQTVARLLQKAGYATGGIGKWALGGAETTGAPFRQGIDFWFGYLDQSDAHNYFPEFLWRNGDKAVLPGNVVGQQPNVSIQRTTYSHDRMTDELLDFVREHAKQPFFFQAHYTIPHANNEGGQATGNGMEVPNYGIYADRTWPDTEKGFAAMISRLDRDVGQIIDLLVELEIEKNTLVLFTSDNGPHQEGGHQVDFFDSNGPLRGYKRDLYEGGIRVPMIAWWPGTVESGGTCDHLSAFWDFLPTACELAGIEPPADIDGLSYLPALLGKEQRHHAFLYWQFLEKKAVRQGTFKAVIPSKKKTLELYHLEKDPGEQKNLADQYPERVAELRRLMEAARK